MGASGRSARGMAVLVPKAGGPSQGHKAPRPVHLPQLHSASRTPTPGPPSSALRAASVSPRARPGRGRGGPGGEPRTCGRRQRVSRPCPACWNSSRPRSRSPLRASVVSAARLRSFCRPPAGPTRPEGARRHSSGRGPRPSRTARWLRAAARTTLRSGCPATAPASRPQRAVNPYRDMRGWLSVRKDGGAGGARLRPAPGCFEVAARAGGGAIGSG